MGAQRLAGLRLVSESKSYIDALHGILSHSGLYDVPKYMLTGMTAAGFRFTVDLQLTSESPTAYNWMAENFLAADFIGVTSNQQAGFSFEATFPLYQREAIHAIKQSIDRGIGAVIWKDQFVIVTGYDDAKGVLFYSDGRVSGDVDGKGAEQPEEGELVYEQFGRNLSPYWYFQIVEQRIELDEHAIYRESFMQAIFKWESHDLMLPKEQYACGKRAYCSIIHALESGSYDKIGAWSIIQTYAAAKRDLARYTQRLAQLWPQSSSVADCYAELNRIYEQIVDLAPLVLVEKTAGEPPLLDNHRLVGLFHEALAAEDKAVQSMKRLMRETVDNRFHDIALR